MHERKHPQPVSSTECVFCGFEVPLSNDRCPHCARPSLFPNVIQAEDAVQCAALDARYQAALRNIDPFVLPVFRAFEDAVARRSDAVIARNSTELFRLAASEKELYAGFYKLVSAGVRVPSDSFWDGIREAVDSKLFRYFKEHVRFAMLSLNRRGLGYYGDCYLMLDERMIAHRSSVFEENSALFAFQKDLGITDPIPPGHFAPWKSRGRLAAIKQAAALKHGTQVSEFPGLLVTETATPEDCRFIEVHIYGSISIRSVASVSIRSRATAVRQRALKEKLVKLGITVKEH